MLCFLTLRSADLTLCTLLDFPRDLSETFLTNRAFVSSEEVRTFALVRYVDARRLMLLRELLTGRLGNGILSRRCFPVMAFTASPKACCSFRFVPMLTSGLRASFASLSLLDFSVGFGPSTPRQLGAPHRHFWMFLLENGLSDCQFCLA